PLDVRVIATTHKDLSKAVAIGDFREDLFQHLQAIPIYLQALEERTEEMDTLVHSTLSEVAREMNRTIRKISAEVAERFESYSWPGNLRELRSVLELAVQSCEGSEITLTHLPERLTPDLYWTPNPMSSA